MEDTARIFDKLMVGLGYSRYVAQGGDWGSIATRLLAVNHSDHCKAVHLNFVPALLPDALSYFPQRILLSIAPSLVLTARELDNLTKANYFLRNESGYYAIQSTKPQTIGYSTTDSPAGLLAWLGEKLAHADITRDELITNIAIYWFSGGGTSSYRVYKENARLGYYLRQFPISVPTGVSVFPKEIMIAPKSWIEYSVNLKWYKENKTGGHFAAIDAPEVFVEDLRSCFKKTWRHASKV
jgi:pimeloyl-ACP methyl ester carboxylesterase